MKEIYIDTLQIHSNTGASLGYFVKPDIKGLEMPDLRVPTFVRPNVDGGVVPNQLYGGRLISFNGKVRSNDVVDYRQKRRNLIDFVSIKRTAGGSLLTRTLKFRTMDDLYLQVEGYVKGFSMPDVHLTSANYKMDFYAPKSHLYSQELVSSNIFLFSGGGMAIPMAIPMSMAVGGSSEVTLTNDGNEDATPLLSFFGPLENPSFVNLTNGQTLNLTYTLTAGQKITVDTQTGMSIYYATPSSQGVNVRQYVSGDFVLINPGANVVKLTNTTYNTDGYINIQYRHTYAGI